MGNLLQPGILYCVLQTQLRYTLPDLSLWNLLQPLLSSNLQCLVGHLIYFREDVANCLRKLREVWVPGCTHVCAPCTHLVPSESREELESSGTGLQEVIDGHVKARN